MSKQVQKFHLSLELSVYKDLLYNKLFFCLCWLMSADGGKDGEDDITYSDLKILQHQQQPIKQSRGSVSSSLFG